MWCGVVWCGVVWCGVAWHGMAWRGVAWRGVAWCGAPLKYVCTYPFIQSCPSVHYLQSWHTSPPISSPPSTPLPSSPILSPPLPSPPLPSQRASPLPHEYMHTPHCFTPISPSTLPLLFSLLWLQRVSKSTF